MPTTRATTAAVITCQPTDEKKGKEVTASNNDERSGPQKKRLRKLCSSEGCAKYAQKGGVCIRHGAKVKRCNVEGCTNYSINGGVCIRHGAKVNRCSFDGCTNIVVKGGVCIKHGAKVKRCNVEGCTNYSINGGVCIRHGAKVKRCCVDGCPNQVKRRGVCVADTNTVRMVPRGPILKMKIIWEERTETLYLQRKFVTMLRGGHNLGVLIEGGIQREKIKRK